MVKVMEGLRLRLQLSSFLFLHRDKEWLAACKRIHSFLDAYIDKAYDQLRGMKLGKPALYGDGRPRNDFLWTIAGQVPDRLELRTQLTGVWIPSNETTSILVSNTLFALARHPDVVIKLRKEILEYGDQPLTFTGLRSLTYLRWVINESKIPAAQTYSSLKTAPKQYQAIDYILSAFRPSELA
jgi:cytochrome P450